MNNFRILVLLVFISSISKAADPMDESGFAKIKTKDNIYVDMRYNTLNNFTMDRVDGYKGNSCFLAKKVASQLKKAASYLKKNGYGLYLFDCYRPQKGVDNFIKWAKEPEQVKSKKEYYPQLEKTKLFELGYIAEKSGHSRGSTVDLSLYKIAESPPKPLDMGTPFDFFSERTHTGNSEISVSAKANRMLLKDAMEKFGFENYQKEWWHYTFKPEPYPDTYFNFDVTE